MASLPPIFIFLFGFGGGGLKKFLGIDESKTKILKDIGENNTILNWSHGPPLFFNSYGASILFVGTSNFLPSTMELPVFRNVWFKTYPTVSAKCDIGENYCDFRINTFFLSFGDRPARKASGPWFRHRHPLLRWDKAVRIHIRVYMTLTE